MNILNFLIGLSYLFLIIIKDRRLLKIDSIVFIFSFGFFIPNVLLSLFVLIDLFIELIMKKKKINTYVFIFSLLVITYVFTRSFFDNQGTKIDISALEIITGVLILNLVAIKYTSYNKILDLLMRIFIFSCFIGLLGIYQTGISYLSTGVIIRAQAVFTNPVTYGTYASFNIILGLILLASKRYSYTSLIKFITFINVIAVLLAMSRASWFGLIAVCFFYLLKSNMLKKLKLFLVVLLSSIFLLLLMPQDLLSSFYLRFLTVFDYNDPSTNYRLNLFLVTVDIIGDNWLFGTGFNNFMSLVITRDISLISQTISHPHNTYLETLQTLGVVGFMAILILLGYIITKFRKFAKLNKNILNEYFIINILIFFFVFAMFDRVLTSFDSAVILWLILGLSINKYLHIKGEDNGQS